MPGLYGTPGISPPITPPEEPITPNPDEVPKNSSEYWRRMAYGWGLQQFGSPEAAQLFQKQLDVETGGFNLDVIYGKRRSSAGAVGIGQFMPGTARGLGITLMTHMKLALLLPNLCLLN